MKIMIRILLVGLLLLIFAGAMLASERNTTDRDIRPKMTVSQIAQPVSEQTKGIQDAVIDSTESETRSLNGGDPVPSYTSPQAGEQIKWQVLASGGNRGISTNYILNGTAGQMAVGNGTSTNYGLAHGYWHNFDPGSCCAKAGDANHSGIVNIQDVTYLINFLYKGGPRPVCQGGTGKYPEGDANNSGVTNIQDVTYLINFLYKGGPAPTCGPM